MSRLSLLGRMAVPGSMQPHSVAFQAAKDSKDKSGAPVRTFPKDRYCSVRCLVCPIDEQLQTDMARREVEVTHAIYTSTDVSALLPGDKALEPAEDPLRSFEVREVRNVGEHGTLWMVYCYELR